MERIQAALHLEKNNSETDPEEVEIKVEKTQKNQVGPTSNSVEWGKQLELVLTGIKEKSLKLKILNIKSARKEAVKYNALMYTLMILGAISGILTSISDERAIQILVIVLSFLSSTISASVRFSKFNQKATQFKSFGAKFNSLKENIDRQLQLSVSERVSAPEYLNWVSSSFDTLYETMPMSTTMLTGEIERIQPVQEVQKIQEIQTDNHSPDHFSDSRMQYELSRLHHLSK